VDCVGNGGRGGGGEVNPPGCRLAFLANLFTRVLFLWFPFLCRGFSGPRLLAHSAPAEGGGDLCDRSFLLFALISGTYPLGMTPFVCEIEIKKIKKYLVDGKVLNLK
jgi:hypothetical protein